LALARAISSCTLRGPSSARTLRSDVFCDAMVMKAKSRAGS
jgi:hypothetical protein